MTGIMKEKPRLKNLDDLFQLDAGPNQSSGQIHLPPDTGFATIPFELMDDFPNHPFRLYEGERESDMAESIRANGILQPFILRAVENNRYQILSGHNRKYAAIKAGLIGGPAVIKRELTEDEAWIYVIETNIMQRSFADMLHSEKAAVIAAQHSRLFSQGKRNDILSELWMLENPHEHRADGTSARIPQKLDSRDTIAKEYSLSKDKVAQYLRIDKLVSALKNRLDVYELGLTAAVALSFLTEANQKLLDKCIGLNSFKVDINKAETLRQYSESGRLDDDSIYLILSGEIGKKPKPNRTPTVKVSRTTYAKYFKPGQSPKEIQGIIERALEMYYKQTA